MSSEFLAQFVQNHYGGRFHFKTQLKIEFLLLCTGSRKVLKNIPENATMLRAQRRSMLPTILLGIVTHDCGLIQAQQYCSILLTTWKNFAPTTLSVFNNLEELIIFGLVHNNSFLPCLPLQYSTSCKPTKYHRAKIRVTTW